MQFFTPKKYFRACSRPFLCVQEQPLVFDDEPSDSQDELLVLLVLLVFLEFLHQIEIKGF